MTPERLAEIDLDELEQLAKEAQPGPWCKSYCYTAIRHVERNDYLDCPEHPEEGCAHFAKYDGSFIAAANPATILALIAHIRDLEAQVREAREPKVFQVPPLDLSADEYMEQEVVPYIATATPPSPEVK